MSARWLGGLQYCSLWNRNTSPSYFSRTTLYGGPCGRFGTASRSRTVWGMVKKRRWVVRRSHLCVPEFVFEYLNYFVDLDASTAVSHDCFRVLRSYIVLRISLPRNTAAMPRIRIRIPIFDTQAAIFHLKMRAKSDFSALFCLIVFEFDRQAGFCPPPANVVLFLLVEEFVF